MMMLSMILSHIRKNLGHVGKDFDRVILLVKILKWSNR